MRQETGKYFVPIFDKIAGRIISEKVLLRVLFQSKNVADFL
jgi:hypothetical protein